MAAPAPIRLLAGPAAARHIAAQGLKPADIAAVAGAAGGPKGLALLPLDRWLFGHWLADCPRERWLAGASIGAWRMAAGAQRKPLPALDRLAQAYLEGQRYPRKPSAALVSQVCRDMTRELIGHDAAAFLAGVAPGRRLQVVTARGLAPASAPARIAFGRAALANAVHVWVAVLIELLVPTCISHVVPVGGDPHLICYASFTKDVHIISV